MELTYSNHENGGILQFSWKLKKDGYSERTILNYSKFLELLIRYGADLSDPESVKGVISLKSDWSLSTKVTVVATYAKYAETNNISWVRPRYQKTTKLPFIPTGV